jgi:hypothetical protein
MTTFIKSKAVKAVVGLLAFVAVVAVASVSHAAYTFTMYNTLGSNNAEVKVLQQTLNANGFTVSTSGAGSAGMESTYFGGHTKSALQAFQAAHGITQTGGTGPLTRAALNALGGTTGGTTGGMVPGCTGTTGFSPTTGAPCNGTGGMSQGTGPVTVALSADNPASGYIVAGGATVDLAHYTFSGSGTISSVTLQRTGLSTNTALTNVYLYQGAVRITDAASVNAQGVITFNGVNLSVSGSTTVSVKADVSSGANGQTVGVTLTGYTVNGTATTAALAGNIMSISSGSGILGSIAFISPSTTSPSVNAGVTGYTLWTSPVQVNLHTMWLKSAAFHFVGSAPTNSLANIGLYIDGAKVASSTGVNPLGYITFDLSAAPFSLSTGSHTVDVRADVVAGSYRTIQLTLQNAGDFMVTDSQVGVNVAAVSPLTSSTSFSPVAGNNVSVNAGSLSIQINSDFNALTNITGGSTNATIAKYDVTAYGEDEKVQTVTITPHVANGTVSDAGSASNLANVELFWNGSQVGSACQFTGSACTFNLGSSLIASAGVKGTLEVRADMQNDTGGNYTAGTVTVASGSMPVGSVQGMNSLQTNASAYTSFGTNGLSINTGSVTVAKNASYTNQTYAPNTSNVKIGSFVIQNGSNSEGVTITNLNVGLNLTSVGSTNYTGLKTSETSGSGATPILPTTATAGNVSNNNFSVNFTIPAGGTKTIDIFADLGGQTGSVQSELNITARGASSNVSICSSNSTLSQNGCSAGYRDGQTITIGNATFGTPAIVTSSSTVGQYVSGGTTTGAANATKAEFKFSASSGTATIVDLGFFDSVGAHAITGVTVGSNTGTNNGSDKFYLYGVNIPVPNGGAGAFVDALASYAPVGATGLTTTTTGDITSLLKLSYVKYKVGNVTQTLCASSAYNPNAVACDVTTAMPISSAQTMTLVGSAPTVSVATPAGVTVNPGSVEAIDVTITPNAAGPITINSFPINVVLQSSGTSGTLAVATGTSNPIIVKDQTGTVISNVATSSNFSSATAGSATITFTGGYLLNNAPQTFKVFLPVASTTSGGTATPKNQIFTNIVKSSGFQWTDTAGNAANPSSGDVTGNIFNYPNTPTSTVQS